MATALELGTRYRTVVHTAPSVPFSSGNVQSVELPKGFLYKTIAVRLVGEYDGTAGSAFVGTELPLALIPKIEIIADGRKTLVAASAKDLYRLSHHMRGKGGELVPPASPTAANQPFTATFLIDLEAARMAMNNDSLFDPNPFEKVEFRVTWGTVLNIATVGAGSTIDTANTSIQLQVLETTVGADRILFNKLISFDEISISATSTALRVRVPRSGLLHGTLFRTERDAGAVDNIVNRITLQSDNTFNHTDSLVWLFLKHRNTIEYQLDGPGVGAANTGLVGYGFIDLTEDGLMSSALNTLDLNALDYVLDVTRTSGVELVRMTSVFYEPILVAAQPR